MKNFLLILLTLIANLSFAQCLEGKIRYTLNKQQITEESAYCILKNPRQIVSRNCYLGECLAKTDKVTKIDGDYFNSPQGSPGFKICRLAGGKPQIIEYWNGKKWINSTRCLFKDKSYISNLAINYQLIDKKTTN